MNLSLIRNTAKNSDERPFFIQADASADVVEPEPRFLIPVSRRRPDNATGIVKELYSAEICGFRVEAGNIHQLVRLVERLLAGLVNVARLPTYVFITRHTRQIFPVYTIDDEVFATTPGGPVFRHVELANVRRYLGDYLNQVGQLDTSEGVETLHARGVHGQTLALIRPVFYLKKRVAGENEFWAPVFESDDGRSIYTFAASARRETPIAGGAEVLALRAVVAEALVDDRRLRDSCDLKPDRVMPAYWQRLQALLEPLPRRLVIGREHHSTELFEMPLYRYRDVVLAVEPRSGPRPGLYIGRDPEDLRDRVVRDYLRRGHVESPSDARVIPAPSQRSMTPLGELMVRQ